MVALRFGFFKLNIPEFYFVIKNKVVGKILCTDLTFLLEIDTFSNDAALFGNLLYRFVYFDGVV